MNYLLINIIILKSNKNSSCQLDLDQLFSIKNRDCTVAIPLYEALELPKHLNKQHRVHADMYVYTHA